MKVIILKIVSIPIEIVTVFGIEGSIKPIRFRYSEEDTYKVIKIDKIIDESESNFAGEPLIIYKCQSVISNCSRLFELKYEKRTCKWYLYKI